MWKPDARRPSLAYALSAHAPFAVGYRRAVFKLIPLALGKNAQPVIPQTQAGSGEQPPRAALPEARNGLFRQPVRLD
jgi:hypothetical protein